MTTPQVLTVSDLAERERVARSTVHTWVLEGEAPKHYIVGKRLIRFRLADVEAWEQAREYDPAADTRFDDWRFESDKDLDLPGVA